MNRAPEIFVTLCFLLFLQVAAISQQVTDYVNPFVGTDGHGHTYPGATMPFGMVQLSPDTRVEGWDACAGYHYSDSTIIGFSHTHLSGTGVPDYGDILFMPTVGTLQIVPGEEKNPASGYRSGFSRANEQASPGYYRVMLEDGNILAELTATRRVGVHRYTFPKSDSSNIIVDLKHGLGPDVVLESNIKVNGKNEIYGMRRSAGWAKDQYIFFVAQFSKPFSSFGTALDDSVVRSRRTVGGKNVKAYFHFKTRTREPIIVKVGISAVSVEGARKNLRAEMPGWNFDDVKKQANSAWKKELGKITVEGGTKEQYRTFYTALYHAMLAPNLFSDVDKRYRGMNGKILVAKDFEMYSVFSLWDTFRAEHPLLTIIDRKRTLDFIKSLLAKYDEGNVLPVWELCANETWCMIGYHAVPVIVDAYKKGIRKFDVRKAYNAMKHSAMMDHYGLRQYRDHGYIPGESESESVSKTLEYAYDDWCIAQMAESLSMKDDIEIFTRRAQYYKNVFDQSTGFMRAKINGSWVEPFDPTSVTVHYTEANAWQYNFFVPQDVTGYIELMGGKFAFMEKLDLLFYSQNEMSGRKQADITGMVGQYAQGNEPSHHVAYLYNYVGAPWKGQYIVRHIMDSLYSSRPDGLCGNDDCGQMSAWYVMSALGFYQVTPGLPSYAIGSPLFRKASVHLENGKTFTIYGENNSSSTRYIQRALLNNRSYRKSYFLHSDLMKGGSLYFTMGPEPNINWASLDEDTPRTPPLSPVVPVPYLRSRGKSFSDSAVVEIFSDMPGADIYYYMLEEENSTVRSDKYKEPVVITKNSSLNVFAMKEGMRSSEIVSASFVKRERLGTIKLGTKYSFQYTGGGDDALIDGVRGNQDFRIGSWQGYEGIDLDAVIDLGGVKNVSEISLGCLQDNNSWIFFPTKISFSLSEDSLLWNTTVDLANKISPKDEGAIIKNFTTTLKDVPARYIKVSAKNIGVCPEWHKGAGGKAWLFVDEISVQAK
jgi:predicted alpha-1,2-mannosidase